MSQSSIRKFTRIILYYYRPTHLPIGIMNLQDICLNTIIACPTDLIILKSVAKIFSLIVIQTYTT